MRDDEWGFGGELGSPFEVVEPGKIETPIVLDSPHSGSRYPRKFLEASRLDPMTLRRSEDCFVDELVAPCVAIGAPLLRARFPRAYLDVNREAGVLLGPKDLCQAAFWNAAPHHNWGRALKVGKEEAMGMLAAVRQWYKRDHEAEQKTWLEWDNYIANAVKDIPSVTTQVNMPDADLSNRAPDADHSLGCGEGRYHRYRA